MFYFFKLWRFNWFFFFKHLWQSSCFRQFHSTSKIILWLFVLLLICKHWFWLLYRWNNLAFYCCDLRNFLFTFRTFIAPSFISWIYEFLWSFWFLMYNFRYLFYVLWWRLWHLKFLDIMNVFILIFSWAIFNLRQLKLNIIIINNAILIRYLISIFGFLFWFWFVIDLRWKSSFHFFLFTYLWNIHHLNVSVKHWLLWSWFIQSFGGLWFLFNFLYFFSYWNFLLILFLGWFLWSWNLTNWSSLWSWFRLNNVTFFNFKVCNFRLCFFIVTEASKVVILNKLSLLFCSFCRIMNCGSCIFYCLNFRHYSLFCFLNFWLNFTHIYHLSFDSSINFFHINFLNIFLRWSLFNFFFCRSQFLMHFKVVIDIKLHLSHLFSHSIFKFVNKNSHLFLLTIKCILNHIISFYFVNLVVSI